MKRFLFILALALTLFVGTATADTTIRSPEQVNADNAALASATASMTDDQRLELLTAAQNIRSGLPAGGQPVASKAKEWVGVGAAIGDGLVATAGKLGVEVNKFATSPVGKLAMVLIVWNYMGDEISGWVCGTIWLLIMVSFWWRSFKRTFGEYNDKGKFIRFDRAMLMDKAEPGKPEFSTVYFVHIVSLGLIAFIGIIFLA